MTEDDEQNRRILTNVDRAWLRGEKEYDKRQYRYDRRKKIRERVGGAILDFPVLFDHLPPEEHREIFGSWGFVDEDGFEDALEDDPEMRRAIRDGISFLYIAARAMGERPESVVEDAVLQAEKRISPLAIIGQPELDVQKEQPNVLATKGRQKMDAGEDLTPNEVSALLETGRRDPVEVASYVRGEETDEE